MQALAQQILAEIKREVSRAKFNSSPCFALQICDSWKVTSNAAKLHKTSLKTSRNIKKCRTNNACI